MPLSIEKTNKLNSSIENIVKEAESFTNKSYFNFFNQDTEDSIKAKIEELEGYQQRLVSVSQDSTRELPSELRLEMEKTQKIITKMIWVGKKKLESPRVQLEKLFQYLAILTEKIEKSPEDQNIDACLKDLFIACDCFTDLSKNTEKELELFLIHCSSLKVKLKSSGADCKDLARVLLEKLIRKVKKELNLRDKIPASSHFKKQVFIFSGKEMGSGKSIAALQKKSERKGQSVTLIDIDTQEGINQFLALSIDESTKYRVLTHGYLDQPSKITPSMLHTLFYSHAKTIRKKGLILPISLVICHSADGGNNSYARQLGKLLNDSGIDFRIKAYEGIVSVHKTLGRKLANGKYDNHKLVFSNEQGKIHSHRVRKLETLNTDTFHSEDFFQLFSNGA